MLNGCSHKTPPSDPIPAQTFEQEIGWEKTLVDHIEARYGAWQDSESKQVLSSILLKLVASH